MNLGTVNALTTLEAAFEGLDTLIDEVGPIQHTVRGYPDRVHGYSCDDAARALVAAYATLHRASHLEVRLQRVIRTSMAFLLHAQRPDGAFRNFMSYGRSFIDEVGSEDTTGRAMWGLGSVVAFDYDAEARTVAMEMLRLAASVRFEHPRASAYAIVGLDLALRQEQSVLSESDTAVLIGSMRSHASMLLSWWSRWSRADWPWVCRELTYANAIVPYALQRVGVILGGDLGQASKTAGDASAMFVLQSTVREGLFDAVGCEGWWVRGEQRASYLQQPIEGGYSAWFWSQSEDALFREGACLAIKWFHGKNCEGLRLFDISEGWCLDGLGEGVVNPNKGAESAIACVLAHAAAVDLGLSFEAVTL